MVGKTGFFWILVAGVLYGAIHYAFASKPVKKWVSEQFELENPNAYHFVFTMQSLFFTVVYVLLIFFLPDRNLYVIPEPWVFLTTIIEIAALVSTIICLVRIGLPSFLGLSAFIQRENKPEAIKTKSFYHYMRHPLFVFCMLMIWLLPYITWNLLAFNIGVTLYMLIGVLVEERKLAQEFGSKYLEYKKRVPPFWPRLSLH